MPCLCQRWESKAKWHCSICGGTGVIEREAREAVLMRHRPRTDGMPDWMRNLIEDHYERVSVEDPLTYESLKELAEEAYEHGLAENQGHLDRLADALLQVEQHHTKLNREKGRPLHHSHTLSIVRSAFSDVGEGKDDG